MLDSQRLHALRNLDAAFHRMDPLNADEHDVLALCIYVDHVLRAFKDWAPTIDPDTGKEVG